MGVKKILDLVFDVEVGIEVMKNLFLLKYWSLGLVYMNDTCSKFSNRTMHENTRSEFSNIEVNDSIFSVFFFLLKYMVFFID